MNDNIKYASAWRSSRQQNRFTAYATDGTEYSVTSSSAPKSIKTIGGLVKWIHTQGAHGDAYHVTRGLKEIETRILNKNKAVK